MQVKRQQNELETNNEEDEDEEEERKVGNWFFAELDKIHFEELLQKKHDEEEEKSSAVKTIDFIVMVGFHHKVGS